MYFKSIYTKTKLIKLNNALKKINFNFISCFLKGKPV